MVTNIAETFPVHDVLSFLRTVYEHLMGGDWLWVEMLVLPLVMKWELSKTYTFSKNEPHPLMNYNLMWDYYVLLITNVFIFK